MSTKSATGWALAVTCLTAIALYMPLRRWGRMIHPTLPCRPIRVTPIPTSDGDLQRTPGDLLRDHAPQTDQGSSSPDWSQGNYGSTSGTTAAPSDAGTTVRVEPPPRVATGDLYWNPRRNVMESQRYDRLVETNPAFHAARIRNECGPITDSQHPSHNIGSSTAPRHLSP
jgi:hypothetical protein